MNYETLVQIIHGLTPALVAGLLFVLVLKWFFRGVSSTPLTQTPEVDIFAYGSGAGKTIFILGLGCLVFAFGPLVIVGLKYYGPDPALPIEGCYVPEDDWPAVFLLWAMFCLMGLPCLVDPKKYFFKMDDGGITVNGLFSGERSMFWESVSEVKDHQALQLLSIRGKDNSGKKRILWAPYALEFFPLIMLKLNKRGFYLPAECEEMEKIKAYLSDNGYAHLEPYELYLPFVSFWTQPSDPEKYVVVLCGVEEDKKTDHYEHFETSVTAGDLFGEVKKKFEAKSFNFHPDFQEDIATGIDFIVERDRQYQESKIK